MFAMRYMIANHAHRISIGRNKARPSKTVAADAMMVAHRSMSCLIGIRSAMTPNPGEMIATSRAAEAVTSAKMPSAVWVMPRKDIS